MLSFLYADLQTHPTRGMSSPQRRGYSLPCAPTPEPSVPIHVGFFSTG